MNEKYLSYRGDIRAIDSMAKSIVFVTLHREKNATFLYRLDPDKAELSEVPLPTGGHALLVDGEDCWIAGDDSKIYHVAGKAKVAKPLAGGLPQHATSLASLNGNRLAAMCGDKIVVVDRANGKQRQTIELSEDATTMAADPTGEWLAVGTAKGNVSVFYCEGESDLQISESGKLHDAAVTSILFEPDELRFLSAGADQKLLLTHARGKLEPEDRGRGASHSDHVTSMLHVPGERFITTGRDKTCKTWTLVGATRPATLSDGVPKVIDSTLVEIHERPHLALAGEDNSIRLFLIDAGGRFGAETHRYHDAYARATHQFASRDVADRGEAVHALANYDDSRSVEMLAAHIGSESDAKIRLQATELLAKSKHPRVPGLLGPLLRHDDEHVRMAAFVGLRDLRGKTDLGPIELALNATKANIGIAAVEALQPLAKKDDLARQLLIGALGKEPVEVRRAAILQLENVFAKNTAEPTLIALKSDKPDVRRLALVRLYQRKLLSDSRVQAAIRRAGDDSDADVRRTAFLVSVLQSEKLALAVRQQDKDLHRHLHEIETFEFEVVSSPEPAAEGETDAASKESSSATTKPPAKAKKTKVKLTPLDIAPLLTAMSSRATDTCLLGACALAALEDARAFATLLQLSREQDAGVRVHVCRALQSLGDERALQRLETLIQDPAAEVRDAALTALIGLRTNHPLDAAEVGLSSQYPDVRRRSLQTLVTVLRRTKSSDDTERGQALMLRVLSDVDPKVRGEAFKASLNLEVAGKGVETLRFVLRSSHESVRREVLTEAMAQEKEDWASELLYDLLCDPNASIRSDALEHLHAKKNGRDVGPLRAALSSPYADLRINAIDKLVKLKSKEAQETLVTAIDDQEKVVRTTALKAIIASGARDVLYKAMNSSHLDVRLEAAAARGIYRDPKSAAPLLAIATEPEPEKKEEKGPWEANVLAALAGMAHLQSPDHIKPLLELTASEYEAIRRAAALALAYSIKPDDANEVLPLLQHDDEHVKYRAALGLALCQQPIAMPMVFSEQASAVLDENAILLAACAYGSASETRLAALLDSNSSWIRNAALFVLLSRDFRDHDGTPRRILFALTCQPPRLRLWAARALEAFGNEAAYGEVMLGLLNQRGEKDSEDNWNISADDMSKLVDVMAFGDPGMVTLLHSLDAERFEDWQYTWKVNQEIVADEIAEATAKRLAAATKLPKTSTSESELKQLAFGTYVGLVRQQSGAGATRSGRSGKPSFGMTVTSIRQAAVRRLVELASESKELLAATIPVIVQVTSDSVADVRTLAFEKLADLGLDDAARAEAGLESGHNDLAVLGLQLLSKGDDKSGQKILADVILQRDDNLAMEVARLMTERIGPADAADTILESPYQPARYWCIQALAAAWDKDPAVKEKLRAATRSRFDDVRLNAASELATQQDAEAFDALVRLLGEFKDPSWQSSVIGSIVKLGDPRSSAAILDRMENDPEKTANTNALLGALGQLRDPTIVPRLLDFLTDKLWKKQGLAAVERISGFDQPIEDTEDEPLDRRWMQRQFPRHDGVLSDLIAKVGELDLWKDWMRLIPAARWSLSDAVDPVLATLTVHPDASLRHAVTEAIGWRLKYRKGPSQTLVTLLEHRDPIMQFLASEGLARAGMPNGVNVLLSAVELMSDLYLRQRAVAALGELSDERAWDVLLRIASDNVHALQQTAAEAIGHLGTTERSDEILKLLSRLASSGGTVSYGAVIGLRWLNTPSGWSVIRKRVRERVGDVAGAIEQLGYNDAPETRDLLLSLLSTGSYKEVAYVAARRLFGDESLEPDYALVKADYTLEEDEDEFHCLKRICESGAPDRIFELLVTPSTSVREQLATHLLSLEPLPVDAAANAIESQHPGTVDVASHVLGRSADKSHAGAVKAPLSGWLEKWDECREKDRRGGAAEAGFAIDEITEAMVRLAWAAGRFGTLKKELIALASTNMDDVVFVPIRLTALESLANSKLTKADLDAIAVMVSDHDTAIRHMAARLITQSDPKRGAGLAEQMLSDRVLFNELATVDGVDVTSAVSVGVANVHYQPVVLPKAIADADVTMLASVATSAELAETARLGAIEGLAKMGSLDANSRLVEVAKDESNSEELRKAAWRGLRRAKRQMAK
ncbi:HEAT repeat domain-containing protein [Novipirellula sp. SH528]|uniref:HEAT repeat domain-containing protein n=1 Tax=Novipirellula sp. SH528 TaxID=3454466 RepID=UPI003FA12785